MDSNPKRPKSLPKPHFLEQTLGHNYPIDRLTDLPDSILCHILSFLPTKYAVGTSILSTRWKNIYSSIPNLALHISDSLLLNPCQEVTDSNPSPNFITFMYNVMNVVLNNAPHIHKFYLHCEHDYGNENFQAWICAALCMQVKELTVSVKNNDYLLLPIILFYCNSLVRLVLDGLFILDVPSSVCFTNLKRLMLYFVNFSDGDGFERLFNGCPLLEDLCIDNCHFDDMYILGIWSPLLKLLMITNCYSDGNYMVVLDVPTLELLYYRDTVAYAYLGKNLNGLLKVHIDIGIEMEQLEEDGLRYVKNIAELVAACSNAQLLFLSQMTIAIIHFCGHLMPTFRNLTNLELGRVEKYGWKLLPHLVERTPNIKVLVFMRGILEYEGFMEFVSHVTEHVPTFLSSRLQKIKFKEFKGEEDELKVVEYFLNNARVLRKMKISCSLSSEKQLCLSKKLLVLPKCSTICEIVLTSEEGKE